MTDRKVMGRSFGFGAETERERRDRYGRQDGGALLWKDRRATKDLSNGEDPLEERGTWIQERHA